MVATLEREAGVTRGKMFGSEGLKIGKSVFAMEMKASGPDFF
ncbi:hypothetical protein WME95_18470 [Sorangium sp. So ce327]